MYIRILMRCNQGGGALQCSSPQCNLIILVSLIILIIRVSHTDRITPRRTASHRSPRHTQTAATSESDPLARALGLEVGGR